jgi:hypothetical protein
MEKELFMAYWIITFELTILLLRAKDVAILFMEASIKKAR